MMLTNKVIWAFNILSMLLNLMNPILFNIEETMVNDLSQTIYTLEIDMTGGHVRVFNGLSFDLFYGFETTSDIAERNNAMIAVNGMFYDQYGMTYGIMIKDYQVVSMSDIYTPTVLISEEGLVTIEDITIQGKVENSENSASLVGVNRGTPDNSFVLYDDLYGKTTRIHRRSINYFITNNIVTDIVVAETPVTLLESDYVLSHVTSGNYQYFEIGDEVSISFEYESLNTNVEEGFQTGGWLVKEGENVASDYESFIGYTTAPSPRTLIGVTADNALIIVVVDGRQAGVSVGVTGVQAAQLMIDRGCEYAAYLDGGASTTMVINGEVVNIPSNEGAEREVAHAVLIQYDNGEMNASESADE
jgi:exopolysaccharide biosynthesis protein